MTTRVSQRQDAVNSDHPSRTPAGDAFSELVVQVFQLDGLLAAAGDALARPTGHTSARWRVLAAIEDAPSTVSHIARLWGLARQSVQRVADALVREGWAAYDKNPDHRRAQLLRLTPRGRRALNRIQAAQRSWADTMGAEVGEADLRRASSVLARILQSLRAEAG
ncbi:MAG TPA: MarR family winged helix-turn-helix transcriptional regulator [Actinomycetota bacterium]|nr:MarR family winged helix-turn-helix transcriptional regulator [Actinomycetota bacterium]